VIPLVHYITLYESYHFLAHPVYSTLFTISGRENKNKGLKMKRHYIMDALGLIVFSIQFWDIL